MFRVSTYILVLVGIVGCGGAASTPLPETVPVSGIVSLDGKPLGSATVTFVPRGETRGIECRGDTDEAGHFSLKQIRGEEGAPPGEYLVVISRFVKSDGTPVRLDGTEQPANVGAAESLPVEYSSFSESSLSAKVSATSGEFKFELNSK